MNELMVFYNIFIKDFKIALSYKFRFIFTFVFIVFQLLIFFYISKFLGQHNTGIMETFGFFLVGICFLDISFTLISYLPNSIEEDKRSGVFEIIFTMPISLEKYLIYRHSYPILLAFFRLFAYLFFGFYLFNLNIFFENILLTLLSIFFGFMSFIGISLIACSVALIYHRGSVIQLIHNLTSVLAGGVMYPTSLISEYFQWIAYFLPIYTLLNIVRDSLGIVRIEDEDIYLNFYILCLQGVVYFSIGLILIIISKRLSLKSGSISQF